MQDPVFYFAYGSNMNSFQLKKRRAEVRGADRAALGAFRLVFNKRSDSGETVYANVEPDVTGRVLGILYRCTEQTLDRLDEYEGVRGGHYYREQVTVELENGRSLRATTYIAGKAFITAARVPAASYLKIILTGAREHGLPATYIAEIERIARTAR